LDSSNICPVSNLFGYNQAFITALLTRDNKWSDEVENFKKKNCDELKTLIENLTTIEKHKIDQGVLNHVGFNNVIQWGEL
jgi:hypothetical protein